MLLLIFQSLLNFFHLFPVKLYTLAKTFGNQLVCVSILIKRFCLDLAEDAAGNKEPKDPI